MAGYSRQSVADIIANAVIKAAPVNAEYNAIRDAFAFAGGHKHDGSSTEGAYVPLIADTDALNKVVIDTANNRIGVFVEVSAAAVEQIRIQDGAILPVTDNDIDLGASGTKFKNLYVNGIASIGSITLSGGTIDNTVIGGTTPAAADFTTMDASGNATVGGTFGVTGNTTIGGTLGVTGVTTLGTANITSADVNSGSIDGTTIGAVTPAAGTFTTLTANTSLTAATADINGGTLDGVTIGATSAAAATVTDLTASGTSTLTTVDINGGTIDGTTIGASSAAAGSFTTVSTSGQATLATADINGGTVDNTVIGATTPAAITGTTITGTSFVGPVTGNVTGNLTGNVTGNVTGDVTGNITSSGSSSFNNVTIDGTLNMNAGTTATITNLTSPTNTNDAATKGYVDTSISNLVDSAPGTLDTLNELAAALGDDPNFSTTITNSIATKLPLAGGTMTGAIAMSTNKITGLGDPTAAQDAVTKSYAEANFLDLTGGTMTGAIDMGSAKITSTYAPTNAADLTNKTYVDAILGSGQDATAAAAAAATSEANAATSETNAANSATAAASSATSAAASYDSFDDRYLGAKASAPTVDNDGDALINGALYFNTTTNIMNVYGSSGWQSAGSAVNGTSDRQTYTATAGQTVFAATYDAGYVDVYLNGVKLLAGTDFTATNGTSITLASGAAVNDIVDIVAYGTFVLADHLTETQSDARYVEVAGDTMTGNLDVQGTVTADGLTTETSDGIPLTINGGANASFVQFTGGTADDFRFGTVNSKGTLSVTNSTDDRYVLDIANNGDISFYEDTGTTAKFFWDASAESLAIGSPSADNVTIYSTDDVPRLEFEQGGTVYADIGHRGASAGARQNIFEITTKQSEPIAFRTSNTERMRIDSSGRLGLGTSSPNAKLEIAGVEYPVARINSSASIGGPAVSFARQGTDQGYIGLQGYFAATSSNDLLLRAQTGNNMLFFTNGNNERMRIDSSGNIQGSKFVSYRDASSAYLDFVDAGTASDANGDVILSGYYPIIFKTDINQERMRIDRSGNLLVSATTTSGFQSSSSESGTIAYAAGGIASNSPSNDVAGVFNRLGNAGAIVQLKDDGTTVGQLLTGSGGYMHIIGGNNTFGSGIALNNQTWNPTNASGTITDNLVKLGDISSRFTDLYLSGGVYLGGTGAANKLEDYEEGTFSPFFLGQGQNPSISYTSQQGVYTKVGRMVHVSIMLQWTGKSGGSGQLSLAGLPFASNGTTRGVASIAYNDNGLIGANGSILIHSNTSSSAIYFMVPSSTFQSGTYLTADSGGLASGSGTFQIAMTYQTS